MKNLREYIRNLLLESIPVDVEIGDIILTGKFKNKRTIVKKIGKDENGQPTINGKSILKFKIEKFLPKKKWSAKSREELNESTSGFKRIFDSPEPFTSFRNVKQTLSQYPDKPKGLWYSCGNSWRDFVEQEGFRSQINHSYEIEIDSSQMYMISSVEEIDAFHEKYSVDGKYEKVIDWSAVEADGYAGIEICPYIHQRRMTKTHFWYYPWDVASGCIWNERAFVGVKEI